jgi:hypothetical protein
MNVDTEVAERPAVRGPSAGAVTLTVNHEARPLRIEPRVSLLDALREHVGLTDSKKGCDQGTCGACTVWVDGRRVLACLTLAVACEGRGHHDRGPGRRGRGAASGSSWATVGSSASTSM